MRSAAVVCAGAATSGFEWPFQEHAERDDLLIAGSTTLLPYLRLIGSEFVKSHPRVDLVIEGGGSGAGLIAVRRGAIDVATMSRDLSVQEDALDVHNVLIGLGAIAIAVHPDSPVAGISREQVLSVFEGRIANWREVGGHDAPIHVCHRKPGSTTRIGFNDIILRGANVTRAATTYGSAPELVKAVAADPLAIGYVTPQDIQGVKPLDIDGVPLDAMEILTGRYPLTRPLFLVRKGDDNAIAAEFIAYACSDPAQKILASRGVQRVH